MSKSAIPPTCEEDRVGQCDPHEVYRHPAFGIIRMTHPHGGKSTLFGSDVGHLGVVRISVHRAEMHRALNRDRISHTIDPIVDFEMTHAQFAEFITGAGRGEGTPITLRAAPETPALPIPAIERVEEKHDLMRREIKDAAKQRLEHLENEVKRLDALIESGKTPKGELREIAANLKRLVEQTPGLFEYVIRSAEETLEKATSDAKIEVEAFIGAKAHALGLDSIQQLHRLEKLSGDNDDDSGMSMS